MLKLNEELKDKISYILIGVVLLSFILPIVGVVDGMITMFQFLAVFCLAGFYALTVEKKDLIFLIFVLFALQQVSFYLVYISTNIFVWYAFYALSKLPYLLSALAFGVLAYKHSKEFKAFELLEFLLVVFLLIVSLLDLLQSSDIREYSKYFVFGICFLIATIIYNNNLWMRYKDDEKNLLIFLLVISFLAVIANSAKFISF